MWWYVYFVPMVPLRVVDYVTCMSCEHDWRAAVLLAEAALLTLLASD